MLDTDKLMMFAPASVATAFASIVLPVPGGPKAVFPSQAARKKCVSSTSIYVNDSYQANMLGSIFHFETRQAPFLAALR